MTSANQSQVIGNVRYDFDSRSGLNLGAFAEWVEHPWFSLNSEISFNQKGRELNMPVTTTQFPNGTGEIITEAIRLHYLSLAVLSKVRLPIGPLQLYALVGPRVDLALGHSVDMRGLDEPFRTEIQHLWDRELDHYRDAQFGGDFALGIHSGDLLPLCLGAEIRYSPDFTAAHAGQDFSVTNESWEYLLVFSF